MPNPFSTRGRLLASFLFPFLLSGLLASSAMAQAAPDAPAQPAQAIPGDIGNPDNEGTLPVIRLRQDPLSLQTIDLTVPQDDLWQRIRLGFAMPDLDSPLVQQLQSWYLARPEYFHRVLERSRLYIHHIVEELDKRGMPTELALLPMVESAYDPMAYSRSHASGMWQFIPSTGKNFNLDQNWWLDERRDIIASTGAALDYLYTLYEMHGDWHLALASYNWGENAVARAIEKNRAEGLPTDYSSLTMPDETRRYIPKLQAIKNIIARPDLFNIRLDPIPNEPYFRSVEISRDIDVATAARLAGISVEEFKALNPAFKRPVIPDQEGLKIILPTDKADLFQINLENHDQPLSKWRAYTLRSGETLLTLARRHGISLARLREVNGITSHMRIGPGHTLLVPAETDVAGGNLLSVNLPMAEPRKPAAAVKKSTPKRGNTRTAKKPPAKSRNAGRAAQKPASRKNTARKH